jgi:acyl-CoA synthetase (AMP-forming)/AMP-acid ligase II
MLHGLMMDAPHSIHSLIEHAAAYHGKTEIVSRTVEGPIHRYTYEDSHARIAKLANALRRLGVAPGDRVATLAWNGYRHFELYFAISGMGAVCHTINPRLFHDQIDYIVNHANDRFIFLDTTFVPLLEPLQDKLPSVEGYVVMTDSEHMPETSLKGAVAYEDLIAGEAGQFAWPNLDERTAASLCYTSGTTGNPRGALFTHRSTVLHSFAIALPEVFNLSTRSVMMPAVPMFHVNAWGLPYACPMTGAKLVLPGPRYDGEAVHELMEAEGVNSCAGVPTIWGMLLEYLRTSGKALSHKPSVVIGGAAPPLSMIVGFEEEYGCTVNHAWGMTEMSPVGTCGKLPPSMDALTKEERHAVKTKQGRAVYGVEMKIVDGDGNTLPHDGKAFGELLVRGPWVISAYFEDEESTAASFDDGWFRTGDVATIDDDGFMQIVDRIKDVIKSGGEWISSITLENTAMGHPGVTEAAVIGIHHPKWDERPLLGVVPAGDEPPAPADLIEYLSASVPKWWLPDDVVFVEELPHTATGKVSKKQLRERLEGHRLPTI